MILSQVSCNVLIIITGYLWPAYQSYKAVSIGDADLNREWCIYWIVFGVVVSTAAVSDVVLFWLPLYWEAKFLLVLFLWHPNVKGALHLFDTMVKPFMASNEVHIDGAIQETQARLKDSLHGQIQRVKQLAAGNAGQIFERIRSFSEEPPNSRSCSLQGGRTPSTISAKASEVSETSTSLNTPATAHAHVE